MTIMEAITRFDALKPNAFSLEDKKRWIATLEGTIEREIIDTHENAEKPEGEELLATHPYDEVYIRYLEMQADYSNGELAKYNNSSALFNNAYSAFARYYNRTHMPLGKKHKFF